MIGGNLIKDIIKEERPRETLLKKGETYLSDSELLAILINNGTRDKSAITLAREIIETSDGIRNLSNITVEELSKIKCVLCGQNLTVLEAVLHDYCKSCHYKIRTDPSYLLQCQEKLKKENGSLE